MLLNSVFGIFFSGEDTGGGQTIQAAITEIQMDYQNTIEEIKRQNAHDVVEISDAQIDWQEILAVYAVKAGSTQEVVTIDEGKKAALKVIFWDAHAITYRTEPREVVEVTVTRDENGNTVETSRTVIKNYLLIFVSHKSAAELAAQYGFSDVQNRRLTELLDPAYADMWNALLPGKLS